MPTSLISAIFSAGAYIKDARKSNPNYGFQNYSYDYENHNDYVTSLMKPVDMRFEQFTSDYQFGPQVRFFWKYVTCLQLPTLFVSI